MLTTAWSTGKSSEPAAAFRTNMIRAFCIIVMHGQFGRVLSGERAKYESRTSYDQEPAFVDVQYRGRKNCRSLVQRNCSFWFNFNILKAVIFQSYILSR